MKIKSMTLIQNKFDPKKLTGNQSVIAIVGKRSAGKKTLVCDLLHNIDYTSLTHIDCSNKYGVNGANGVDGANGVNGAKNGSNIEIIKQLIQIQKRKIGECLKSGSDPETDSSLNSWLVIKNFTHDTEFADSEDVKSLFMNSKLWKIGIMICFQYVSGRVPLYIRSKIDYLFCLKDNNIDDQQLLHTTFFENYDKFSCFQDTFVSYTQNYGCLVLDRKNITVSHYTAEVISNLV